MEGFWKIEQWEFDVVPAHEHLQIYIPEECSGYTGKEDGMGSWKRTSFHKKLPREGNRKKLLYIK